jgi:hypothetical protein
MYVCMYVCWLSPFVLMRDADGKGIEHGGVNGRPANVNFDVVQYQTWTAFTWLCNMARTKYLAEASCWKWKGLDIGRRRSRSLPIFTQASISRVAVGLMSLSTGRHLHVVSQVSQVSQSGPLANLFLGSFHCLKT